jgi:hypothetical protein
LFEGSYQVRPADANFTGILKYKLDKASPDFDAFLFPFLTGILKYKQLQGENAILERLCFHSLQEF